MTRPTMVELDDDLAAFVRRTVSMMQSRHLNDDTRAAAALAKLRRAVTAAPGSRQEVWEYTLKDLPQTLIAPLDADPTQWECAAHYAITLHALHQQSSRIRTHREGNNIGHAVYRLGLTTANDAAVQARFHALIAASSLSSGLIHLRGLIRQFRSAAIPLDYGRLARDLRRLQDHKQADQVRLEWGRGYHHQRRKPEPLSASDLTDSTGASSE
ncbi:type I-E CRISPR-associated protein Cse2/CasB [Nocardia brasiliensis]|uniref:Type I-E CRISPR-associated protein Cse2/CasB n=1 Tax=Nocardia brasiliensis TaxID=37326 RepID=A0A6G9XXE4_NOCBR|nr:type I-E CRISPR-associated protein Cse2/CasB [Nocardia brasiliensis]QIS05588.1 type I-E CRISPR-associated protein Cse2/CasB [Nocardia brasiliensis]